MTAVLDTTTSHRALPQVNGGVGGLLRGEWVKLRSLRSTWLSLAVGLVLMVLFGWLFTATAESGGPGGDGGGPPGLSFTDPVGLSLAGYRLAQLAIGVLGVLLVTGEYSTGTIRSTFAAVPRRWPVVAAKAGVFAAVVFVGSLLTGVVAFLIGQASLGDLGVGLGADGVVRALLGLALYLTAIGLFGMALGWLLRSTAGAISTLFGLVFLLPVLGQLLPASWGPDVVRLLPGEAGAQLFSLVGTPDALGPWSGAAVLLGYLVVAFTAATVLLRRRDA
ncbi:ABC transporter permease subunit [Modestobacter muralis]|uniref:ABC transporter permease subunit n=1 Tax=Modestobacter muralis TaxID=1608614 RepID=A0A6P0H1B1_9ACTN|nr:ABC transporter permease subunit [Modestobacter muralis]NEK92683.1 ABC transporter permease subunit [Modestobacter muralis]NEN49450.1 ABC transporter permease subunit [Modestobacter muralis]